MAGVAPWVPADRVDLICGDAERLPRAEGDRRLGPRPLERRQRALLGIGDLAGGLATGQSPVSPTASLN